MRTIQATVVVKLYITIACLLFVGERFRDMYLREILVRVMRLAKA